MDPKYQAHLNSRQSELEVIAQVECNFLALEQCITEKSRQLSQSPFVEELISIPFKILKTNQQNPIRSFSDFCAHALQDSEVLYQVLVDPYSMIKTELADPSMFLLSADSVTNNQCYAYFKGSCRLLKLGADSTSLAGLSTLYHELVHVAIDNTERSGISSSADLHRYLQWEYPTSSRAPSACRVPDECWAYGMQIELLNVLLDRRLERGITANDYSSVLKELGTPNSLEGTISFVLHLSQSYFPFRPKDSKGFSPRFINYFKECMKVARNQTVDYPNQQPSMAVVPASNDGKSIYLPGYVLQAKALT